MSKVEVRRFQKCDFCHNEYEIDDKNPADDKKPANEKYFRTITLLNKITLPGYYVECDGTTMNQMVTGSICKECMQRLREKLREFIDLKEMAYGGEQFNWIEKEK